MALPKDVVLPRSRAPRFPASCVVCGLPDPDSAIVVRTRGIRQLGLRILTQLSRLFGAPLEVRAPACAACAEDYRGRRRTLRIARWIAVVALSVACGAILGALDIDIGTHWFGGELVSVIAIGLALVVVAPIEYFFMLPFDVTLRGDDVEYEFTNHELAERFAQANGATVDD